MKKRILAIFLALLLVFTISACGTGSAGNESKASEYTSESGSLEPGSDTGEDADAVFHYHFADRDEAVKCYLSNEDYFEGLSTCDLEYRLQKKGGTIEELKDFGASQMEEFTEEEKAFLEETLKEMENDMKQAGLHIPELNEITFIKSTQQEECDSGGYTHGTQIFMGEEMLKLMMSEEKEAAFFKKEFLWHELFHCLTRSNPQFRKDMYKIIHFSVQDQDYELPPSVKDVFISNPDVEHHNAWATFDIKGKKTECFAAWITTKPFEKKGDSFFEYAETALIPVDGSDTYYVSGDASNFWDVFGKNTDYVTDPEECMANNFCFALVYGLNGKEYPDPEIIEQILDYLKDSPKN